MRNTILSLFLFIALPGLGLAAEAKLLSYSGAVEVRQTRAGQWVSAADGMEISEGGGVRTGTDGAAVVYLPNKSKVWMKESTSLEIEQRQTLASRLALVFGRIKVRVPHLMRKEKFEVRTPAAICAVRGTEFTMGADEGGKTDIKVLFGEVKFKFTVPQAKGKSEFYIPQGQGLATREDGKPTAPALLTAKAEREAMENWNPGLKADERQKELQQKENDRAQIKDFAKATANAENVVKAFTNVVKESDLEAGRTLTDVHGNLVRVDQRLMRPDARTLQFMNLVKRPSYSAATYSNGYGFAYNGGAVPNRLDYLQMNMGFNTNLPQRIEEWPSFFSSNSVKPTYSSFLAANRTDASDIFFVAQLYKYDAARDELVNNEAVLGLAVSADKEILIAGVLGNDTVNAISAVEGLNRITRGEIADNAGGTAGDLKYTGTAVAVGGAGGTVRWAQSMDVAGYGAKSEDFGGDSLWNYNADLYNIGAVINPADSDKIWLAQENYVINNGGAIRSSGDITSSGKDPFTLLKSLAGQTVLYVKKYDGLGNDAYARIDKTSTGDRFSTKNIDLVFVPDLMVAAVQRMLPALTNLSE